MSAIQRHNTKMHLSKEGIVLSSEGAEPVTIPATTVLVPAVVDLDPELKGLKVQLTFVVSDVGVGDLHEGTESVIYTQAYVEAQKESA